MSDSTRQPGQALLCRGCRHWASAAWAMGHPSPCNRFGWVGDKRVSPKLAGDTCSDYEPRSVDVAEEVEKIDAETA